MIKRYTYLYETRPLHPRMKPGARHPDPDFSAV
jgi:hypothetical protein